MTKKTDENLTPTFDESTDTKIYEKDVDTGILNAAQQAIEKKILEDFQMPQAAGTTDLPTISWGSIGDYRIIRKIGEGGMGIVYEAEQQNPRRAVALKVIRGGFHADEYHIKLFEREIQALARLKHPGIADIYESGRSDEGQIFFAMELVRGTSLLEFVRRRKFSQDNLPFNVEEQLELFRKICEVVSYAHQRGVIHRDLKPDNILVTDESEGQSGSGSMTTKVGVKILDFGLARITDPDVVGTDQLSKAGQIKGTLQYMSPEQVLGKPDEIDVRSDVYSLGVILYEMLTDQLPYDVSQVLIPEAVRIIIEQQPKTPSIVWNETHGEGRKRSGKIDKDVETIVLKALEKDPERRYQSVQAMSDDIERFLTNKPILARPASAFYQFRKLVARHKAAFASVAIIFLMLLGFAVVMAAQSARLARERDRAVKAEQIAEEQKNDAERSRQAEQKQRLIAEENLNRAEEQQIIAEKEKALAEKAQKAEQEQRLIAEQSLMRAREEQIRAEEQTALAEKQEAIAQEQKTLAEKRQIETEEQRIRAEEQKTLAENREESNRRLLYVSQINLAEQAWKEANISLMEKLLENQIPKPGQEDLRGFEWYYLWRLSHRDLMTFRQTEIFSAEFSPDGNLLAVHGSDFEDGKQILKITLLDVVTGKEIETLKGEYPFFAFSPDGNKLVLSQWLRDKKTIEILDLKTKQIRSLLSLQILSPFVPEAAFSPDGKLLAVTFENIIELWDISTEEKVFSFEKKEKNSRFSSIRFSPDGKVWAAASTNMEMLDGQVKFESQVTFWDVATKRELNIIKDNKSVFSLIAFSPDGKILATRGYDETIKLWDVASKQEIGALKTQKPRNVAGGLEFSPDGKILAVTDGRTVKLWDAVTRKELTVIKGHGNFVVDLSFSPDSKKLATASFDGTVKMWHIPFSEDFEILEGQVGGAFSPDGKTLATTTEEGKIKLWDFAAHRELTVFGEDQIEPKTALTSPLFAPNGKILAVRRLPLNLSFDYRNPSMQIGDKIELWDIVTEKKLASLGEDKISDYAFSPDSRTLAVLSAGKKGGVWDAASGKMLFGFEGEGFLGFLPDSKTLATVGSDDTVKLIDISNGQELLALKLKSAMYTLELSPDGKILAASDGKNILLWDFVNRKEIGSVSGHGGLTLSMSFSPDSKRLATFNQLDRTLKIWDIAKQQLLITIETALVTNLGLPKVFSPDGKSLIGVSSNGVVIWRGATEEEILKQKSQ